MKRCEPPDSWIELVLVLPDYLTSRITRPTGNKKWQPKSAAILKTKIRLLSFLYQAALLGPGGSVGNHQQ
jgi:hypothetical protein